MRSVLITGASSYVGRSLALALLKNGFKVYPIVNNATSGIAGEIRCDLRDFSPKQLPKKVDFIVHLAAKTGSKIADGDQEAFDINVGGTLHLLDYACSAGIKNFLYFSTGSVYKAGNPLIEDRTPLQPRNFYALTKLMGEEAVRYYSKNFRFLILRLAYPYGPGEESGLVGGIASSIKDGREVYENSGGRPFINPIHIDDLTSATLKGLDLQESMVINLGGPDIVKVGQVIRLLSKRFNKDPFLRTTSETVDDEVVDINRMRRYLVVPKISFEEGIKQL